MLFVSLHQESQLNHVVVCAQEKPDASLRRLYPPLLTWHTERGRLAAGHHSGGAVLPTLRLAPVAARVLPRYSRDGVAVTGDQVPGVRGRREVRFVPEPAVAPHRTGVWFHCALQQHALAEVDVWPGRPHRHADLHSLCRKTRTPLWTVDVHAYTL